jgi:hypothetical protein
VWFPLFNYAREPELAGPPNSASRNGGAAPDYNGWATKVIENRTIVRRLLTRVTERESERRMIALLVEMTALATIAVLVAWAFHHWYLLGHPHQWLYYTICGLGLAFIGGVTGRGLFLATKPSRKATAKEAHTINVGQVVLMFVVIAALP